MCFDYMEKRSNVGNLYCLNMIESKDTSKPPNEKVRDLWKINHNNTMQWQFWHNTNEKTVSREL